MKENKYKPQHDPAQDGPYDILYEIMSDAINQAENGKGKERHACAGEAFEDQKICRLNSWCASGAIFQACKKAIESGRLERDAAIRELYGAINYLCAEVIRRRAEKC